MATIIGRDAELGAVAAALEAEIGGPRIVLIEGDAGIGKSTIWSEATVRAARAGWQVLVARASETESTLTLATLTDLIDGLDDERFDALPEPQRTAILGALLRVVTEGATPDPRLLGTAVRNVLGPLAAEQPLVLAVDDAQWIDPASAQVLAFALRRLPGARIAILASRRTPLPLPPAIDGVIADAHRFRVSVAGLSVGALHRLLQERRGDSPSRSTLVRIHEASDGNPLFALEISRLLEEVGAPPAGEPLPVPDDVRELLRRRLASLDPAVLEVLLDAALLGRASVERLERVAGRAVARELGLARDEGLVRVADLDQPGSVVTFAHPLHAAAVMQAMPIDARRRAHARLASSADSLDERARHAALATSGPDESVAAQLQAAAAAAVSRGAPSAAIELLRLAIDRTPAEQPGHRADREVALGVALIRAGETPGATDILEHVAAGSEPTARARARLELAAIHYDADGSTAAATRLCEEAILDAAGDLQLLARAWATLAAVDYEDIERKRHATAEAARLLGLLQAPDPATAALVALQQAAAQFLATGTLDAALVREGLRLDAIEPAASVSARFSAALGTWLKEADDFDGATRWLRATLAAAEAEGDEASMPFALNHLAQVALLTGAWADAEALAARHHELATELRVPGHQRVAQLNLAAVQAHRGQTDAARQRIDAALAPALAEGDDWAASELLALLGFVELSAAEPAAAAAALDRAAMHRNRVVAGSPPLRGGGDLVEALVALGRLDQAEAVLLTLEADAERLGWHQLRARRHRARGLLLAARGALPEAEIELRDALREHDQIAIPFERARTLLVLGQVRRRLRERAAARDAFAEARSIFEQLGAAGWAARADAELARTGIRRGSGSELTESERRVAELAAAGHTNREVAAALFMSPKTVGASLARAYAKLGIKSRAELGAVIGRPQT